MERMEASKKMRRATLLTLAAAFAGAASAEVRSSSSYTIEKEVLSGGGGSTSASSCSCFSSFAQPQTGQLQGILTARLGFLAGGGAAPAPPLNLTSNGGDGQMSLDWDDNTEVDLAGYNVYRSETQGGPYAMVNAALVMVSNYTDTGLVNGTTYYYVVTAVNDSFRESGYSNESWETPSGAAPAPPLNLTSNPGDGQMSLDWDDNTEPDLAGYNVYRSEAQGGPYAMVNAALVMASDYADTGLVNGTTYYYVVTAVDDAFRESTDSNEASATPSLEAGIEPGVLGGGCGGNVCAFLAALAALALARRSRRS